MPSSPRGHVVDASGDVIGLLGRKRVVRVRRLAFVIVFAFVSWSCFQGAQNSIRAHRKRSLLHTHYVANPTERVKSELAPCIDPNEETARAMESSSSDESALRFVTFAFTRDPGARWEAASARRALRLMYSSLARAHAILPRLHVYTDSAEVIPSETSFGVKTKIHVHTCASDSFPFNPYTKIGKWAQISRAKLDVVEDVLLKYGGRVIWVDLDTLVFVDLSDTQTIEVDGVKVSWLENDHPGRSFSYRVEYQGHVAVLSTDAEYKSLDPAVLDPVLNFFSDADVLIFDAQYGFTESVQLKRDWGHSSSFVGVDLALDAGVKRLALFHHEPKADDFMLVNILKKAQAYLRNVEPNSELEIFLAHEDLVLEFG